MDVFIAVISFGIALISFKMENIINLLKVLFSLIIAYYLTNAFYSDFEVVKFHEWTWKIVFSTFKMSQFWIGLILMILIQIFFYWVVPTIIFLKLERNIKPFFINKISTINNYSKNKSLVRMRKMYAFLFKIGLISYTEAKEEIVFLDYSKGIIHLFCITLQLFIIILVFDLSLLYSILSLLFLLILFVSIIISPVILYTSKFIYKLYTDEYHRNNQPIS